MQQPDVPSSPVSARVARLWLLGYALLLCLLVLQASERPPYDDSYFFKRFALNFLDHGVFAWNVADGPVYGNTSQLHQLLVALLTAITRGYALSLLRWLLAAALFAGLASTLSNVGRYRAGNAALLAFCSPVMLFCALSGMETACVFALLAVFLRTVSPGPPQRSWALAPSLCVVLWLARPESLLLTVPLWLASSFRARSRWLRGLLLISLSIGLCLIVFRLYYGTALPLPFYAKQRGYSPYDAHFLELARLGTRERFSVFAWAAAPLCLIALARRDLWNLALLGSALLFVLYHLLTTVDIMGMHGRFYAPVLPQLALAASRGERIYASSRLRFAWAGLYLLFVAGLFALKLPPLGDLEHDDNLTPAYYALGTLAALCVLLAPRQGVLQRSTSVAVLLLAAAACLASFGHPQQRAPRRDDQLLTLAEGRYTVYRGLETLRACFGDAIHVYHSEVGLVGLRFEHGTVTDLAGLLSPDWLFRRFSFDDACQKERPEGLFLPHRVYTTLNQEIARSRCIKGYRRVVQESSSPLHVRSDLFRRYQACARANAE